MTKSEHKIQNIFQWVEELKKSPRFPKKELLELSSLTNFSTQDVLNTFNHLVLKYQSDHQYFRDIVMLIYLTLLQGST